MQLVDVTAVTPLDGYTVRVCFSDGLVKEIDLAPYLRGPIFAAVREPALFRQVQIADGAISWPNGADIDTQVLRYGLTPASWEQERSSA
jgi:hypothetical protein